MIEFLVLDHLVDGLLQVSDVLFPRPLSFDSLLLLGVLPVEDVGCNIGSQRYQIALYQHESLDGVSQI